MTTAYSRGLERRQVIAFDHRYRDICDYCQALPHRWAAGEDTDLAVRYANSVRRNPPCLEGSSNIADSWAKNIRIWVFIAKITDEIILWLDFLRIYYFTVDLKAWYVWADKCRYGIQVHDYDHP
jgi:hypothetical protein